MNDTINVFNDQDVQPALQRLLGQRPFMMLVTTLAPDMNREKLGQMFSNIHTIKDFQNLFIVPVVDLIIEKTTKGLTYTGVENLKPEQAYLFISNHRDIILDSTFLNYILLKNGIETTQLAIGDNLLVKPWIADFLRLNKSFLVRRNIPAREIYQYSVQLSGYIRNTIMKDHTSIWIAQREGRAKDGHDATQTGVLKMLSLGSETDFGEHFKTLNIVPVSISYEMDPNASPKIAELYTKKISGSYTKSKKDDIKSMITGIVGPKGRVHVNIGKPICEELDRFPADLPLNGKVRMLADLLDKFIHKSYKLWPANYIAADMLNSNTKYEKFYTNEDKQKFSVYLSMLLKELEGDPEMIKEIFLSMFANPVINQYKQESEE